MKKIIVKSLVSSVAISAVLMVFNRIYAAITGHIIGVSISGGDCVERIGFGCCELILFPELNAEQAALWKPVSTLQFDIISFMVTILILFVVTLIIRIIKLRKEGTVTNSIR